VHHPARQHRSALTHRQTSPGRLSTMHIPKLRVGQPITPEQFEELSDEHLLRLIPKAYREFFPGKDFCADGYFYLHDGTAWSFYRGSFLDE
jgi:hypothetical protein